MTIQYIWVKKYQTLEEAGFCFSNEFIFHYEDDILTIEDSPYYIENFFSEKEKNINSITGIIGDNGAGKTTIIKYILRNFVKGFSSHEMPECIMIYKDKGQLYLYHHELINVRYSYPSIKIVKTIDELKHGVHFIFHSNHFDPLSNAGDLTKKELSGQTNLSTFHLLKSDYTQHTGKDPNRGTSYDQIMVSHSKMELNRFVSLIRKYSRKEILTEFPSYLVIEVNLQDVEAKRKQYSDLNMLFDKLYPTKNKKDAFSLNLFKACIFNYINNYSNLSTQFTTEIVSILHKKLEQIDRDKKELKLSDILELISILKRTQFHGLEDEFIKILDLYELLVDLITLKNISPDGISFFININSIKREAINKLIDIYSELKAITKYIDLRFSHDKWTPSSFSSGEYTMMSIFSRLLWSKRKPNPLPSKKNIILLLDEAEIGLHPRWQLQFLKVLSEFISIEFKGFNIQLILTSHSPFIVSDLPPNCTIFMKKENEKTIIFNGLKNHNETFGANIHKLFQNSFFVDDGLIGQFALAKINALILELNKLTDKSNLTAEQIENYERRIKIIGEPFIKNKLFELLSEKCVDFRVKLISEKELELEQRKRELDELKKNNKNN